MRSVEYLGVLYIGRTGVAAKNFHIFNTIMNSDVAAVVPERTQEASNPDSISKTTITHDNILAVVFDMCAVSG